LKNKQKQKTKNKSKNKNKKKYKKDGNCLGCAASSYEKNNQAGVYSIISQHDAKGTLFLFLQRSRHWVPQVQAAGVVRQPSRVQNDIGGRRCALHVAK
jgi:hypothetical protein